MEFEWSGITSTEDYGSSPQVDVLYDQHPHRAFIYVLTTKNLKLSSITLRNDFDYSLLISHPRHPKWLDIFCFEKWKVWLESKKSGWRNEQGELVKNEVNMILNSKPSIQIIPPENCAYLNNLHFKSVLSKQVLMHGS